MRQGGAEPCARPAAPCSRTVLRARLPVLCWAPVHAASAPAPPAQGMQAQKQHAEATRRWSRSRSKGHLQSRYAEAQILHEYTHQRLTGRLAAVVGGSQRLQEALPMPLHRHLLGVSCQHLAGHSPSPLNETSTASWPPGPGEDRVQLHDAGRSAHPRHGIGQHWDQLLSPVPLLGSTRCAEDSRRKHSGGRRSTCTGAAQVESGQPTGCRSRHPSSGGSCVGAQRHLPGRTRQREAPERQGRLPAEPGVRVTVCFGRDGELVPLPGRSHVPQVPREIDVSGESDQSP